MSRDLRLPNTVWTYVRVVFAELTLAERPFSELTCLI